ncbi:MAG: FAD-dependent oxidoreductase [Myxococcota bacterium]
MTDFLGYLPEHLRERVCRGHHPGASLLGSGAFILVWMRTAVRAHENPALDVALAIGRARGLPVFVYHALDERHPHANDRLHTFMLEGARDVARALSARRIGYALHVSRPGQRGPYLKHLAMRAALVVTEEVPVPPLARWTDSLRDASSAPVLTVDTACVVPMPLTEGAHARSFHFKKAVKRALKERIDRTWPEQPNPDAPFVPEDLGFEPVDIRTADIPALVSVCDIDHSVPPVPESPGGSTAGYARFEAFLARGLARYHERRGDPSDHDGSSRMSAYLHFGYVSPMRIARKVHARNAAGAPKYLDELITWRELAHHFCFHTDPDTLHTLDALPTWAKDTLSAHASDTREQTYTLEQMERAATDDAIWNLAQRSLLRHGELHNNFRMTWGKQVLSWASPQAALDAIIHLNHHYALDGRDPSSYGGLLWCLGLFDKPSGDDLPVFGGVRRYATDFYGERLKVEAYRALVERPQLGTPPRVAIVGAGMAGLTAARALADQGADVTVFDKGAGPGGRMSSKLSMNHTHSVDHGAQYFTARDTTFRRLVRSWVEAGVCAEWDGAIVRIDTPGDFVPKSASATRYVGTPHMHSVAHHLARDLTVHTRVRVAQISREGATHTLHFTDDSELPPQRGFDWVIVNTPSAQAAPLLAHVSPELAGEVATIAQQPCWSAIVTFDTPLPVDLDAAFVHLPGPLSWVSRNSSKPGRATSPDTWVLHASPSWSVEHLEHEQEAVAEVLCDALLEALGIDPVEPSSMRGHRWRYARGGDERTPRSLADLERRVLVCGDWLAGGRVEGAFLSGASAAGRLMGELARAAREQGGSATQASLF